MRFKCSNVDILLFRYGDTWTPSRRNCEFDGGDEETFELETTNEEAISSLNGYSNDGIGSVLSLSASTTAGRTWGPHGTHEDTSGFSLRDSPNAKLKLRFISGDETERKWILRYNQM